jgi:peptidoglycan/LPS O-acetylase OafA/YrhL
MTYRQLTKYRQIWMAVAILWVVFSNIRMTMPNAFLTQLQAYGYGGADIFFFASGVGCCFSLSEDEDARAFFKRRAQKILFPYFIVIIIWIYYRSLFDPLDMISILGNLLSVQQFTGRGNAFHWYFSAMWLFYFVAPWLVGIVRKLKKPYQEIGLLILMWFIAVPFLSIDYLSMIAARLPIFVLGIVWGKRGYEEKPIGKASIFLWSMMMAAGIALLPFSSYSFFFIVPGFCLIISMISQFLDAHTLTSLVVDLFWIVGDSTFELFLVQTMVFEFMYAQVIVPGFVANRWKWWIISLLLVINFCVALKTTTENVRSVFMRIDYETDS